MKYYHALSPALIGVSMVLVQSQVAVGLSASEVEKIAREITVQVVDSENPNFAGSGTIIKHTGNTYTVLTAGHVAKGGKKQIITPDKQSYQIKNIKPLPSLDLAVVEFNSNQTYTTAKIGDSDKVKNNSVVYVAGFPAKTAVTPNVDFRMKDGKVDAKGSQRDGYDLSYDNRTSRGMSGGAILNEEGELIGIHGRAITEASEEDPGQVVITGASGTTIYSSLRQMLAVGVDVGVKPPNVVATAPTADDFYIKGNEKYGQKDYKGARADFTEAIRLNPNSDKAYYSRGIACYKLGDKQGAIADFNSAIKINPNNDNAYIGRGNVRSDLGDKLGAIADFNSAIKINPNLVEAYNNRGVTRSSLGDKQGAIADYNSAIKINPNLAQAYNNRGNARDDLGDKQGAIADYNSAIKINPNNAYAYYNRGVVRDNLGDKQGGIADLQKAAELFQQQGNTASYQQALELIRKYQR
jgi:tetratricopeptide (TPR) repeat protein